MILFVSRHAADDVVFMDEIVDFVLHARPPLLTSTTTTTTIVCISARHIHD